MLDALSFQVLWTSLCMKSIPDTVTKDGCLVAILDSLLVKVHHCGHTVPNDEVKETDQKYVEQLGKRELKQEIEE